MHCVSVCVSVFVYVLAHIYSFCEYVKPKLITLLCAKPNRFCLKRDIWVNLHVYIYFLWNLCRINKRCKSFISQSEKVIKNEHINNNNHLVETENEAKDKCFEELTKRMAAEKNTARKIQPAKEKKQTHTAKRTQFGPPVDIDCYYVLLLLRSYNAHMMKIADNSASFSLFGPRGLSRLFLVLLVRDNDFRYWYVSFFISLHFW